MSIAQNLIRLRQSLPQSVKLVAVSKFHSPAAIWEAYEAGQRLFGESRVQELLEKQRQLPTDIEWHFIGHLQTNKVKSLAPFIALIHSVDSLKLLEAIDREGQRINRVIPCLLQLHIAQENSKYGFSFDECRDLFQTGRWIDFRHVHVKGLMGMATFTDDEDQIRQEFRLLHEFFLEIKTGYFPSDATFNELSMGMSNDYLLAIQEGSTLVRIGTLIFGHRDQE
jgi:pyridoxal phosphate enzyme (YggS family)